MNKEDYLSDADMDAMHDALDECANNCTQFTDKQIAAFTVAAEAMKANGMDYWPHALLGLEDSDYMLACLEDDAVWLVDISGSCSFRDFVKVQKILG